MFDFEKLDVYQKVKQLNVSTYKLLKRVGKHLDTHYSDQWKRASLSILLNIAEGSGRQSANDKKHFYTVARGSLNECVAFLSLANELNLLEQAEYDNLYRDYESASKMLLALYRSVK